MGLGASVVVHLALFAWVGVVERPVREPAPELFEVELVEIGTAREEPIAAAAGDEAEDEEPAAGPEPSPVERRVRSRPTPSPVRVAERTFEGRLAVEEPPELGGEQREVAVEPAPSTDVSSPTAVAGGGVGPSGRGSTRSGRGTPGPLDHSSYGAEIVRIVVAEIDRDPVPGIGPDDTIQVLLDVLPNGELAWTRAGRYGFAQVLRSSLGRTRTRRILRRIERASNRFPAHPAGFARRHYVVDVTVNFSKQG